MRVSTYTTCMCTVMAKRKLLMAKRKLEQEHELEVSEINNEVSSATVHGVLVELSPIKKSRDMEYFEGKVSDGKEVRRLVSFEPKL